MLRHLGYVAIALSIKASTNRTCRLRNATPDLLSSLVRHNLMGLKEVLLFNLSEGIYLYRISSQVVPLASHPAVAFTWWERFSSELREIGEFIAEHGMRVSMHPGQFTVLNSPDPGVVAASVSEIEWHVRFLDALGVGQDSKIVIHLGGGYGDKHEAMARFSKVVSVLPPSFRKRLAIENDERVFSADDALEASSVTGLPVVFDWLHHQANPGSGATIEIIRRCFDTWRSEDGPPKVHLSSQVQDGRLGQHADFVDPADAMGLFRAVPDAVFDCMLEAKRKDHALLRLRHQLRNLGIVAPDSIVTPVERY